MKIPRGGPPRGTAAHGRRVGLLGGSFNPAHGGHRAISMSALRALALDEVWWLVSPGNPLKAATGMAPLPARVAHAAQIARRAPIRVTAIERELGTRYTVDTLDRLVRRYPRHRFVWLMGGDNLQQFPRWRRWRRIARTLPIAVVARPGYNRRAASTLAMGWLRRFVRPVTQARNWTQWSPPAIVLLRFSLDPRTATSLRSRAPDWHCGVAHTAVRDHITHRAID